MIFSPAERKVFPYYDGAADAFADPLEVWDRIYEKIDHDGLSELTRPPARAPDGATLAEPAESMVPRMRQIAELARHAFDLKTLDRKTGEGLTWQDMADVLFAFWSWEAEMRKKSAGPPKSSPPSDGPAVASGSMGSPAPAAR